MKWQRDQFGWPHGVPTRSRQTVRALSTTATTFGRSGVRLGVAVVCLSAATATAVAIEFPGPEAGRAEARLEAGQLVLQNNVLAVTWDLADGRLRLTSAVDRTNGRTLQFESAEAFCITLSNGSRWTASRLKRVAEPRLSRLAARPEAVRQADRFAGWQASVPLVSPDGRLRVQWSVTLRDGANYVTQTVTLRAVDEPVAVQAVTLLELAVPDARTAGKVAGSPMVAGDFFFACEHPTASNRGDQGHVVCSSRCLRPVTSGRPWTRSAVIGVVPRGQLRRGFLYYVERERARPYRLFLHYSSWWDIATGGKLMNEAECLEVIELFGRELVQRRGHRFVCLRRRLGRPENSVGVPFGVPAWLCAVA